MQNRIKHGVIIVLVSIMSATPFLKGAIGEVICTPADNRCHVSLEQKNQSIIPDILDRLGISESLADAGELGSFRQTNTVLSVSSDFMQISIRQVFQLAELLANGRWFLTGQMAIKGNRTLSFGYDCETRLLRLDYTEEFDKPIWPDVLTPALSCRVPVFPFGKYVSSEPVTLPDRVDIIKLVYDDVSPSDMSSYEALLIESGYILNTASDEIVEYSNNHLFVELSYIPEDSKVEIMVGGYLVYYVALPPWPDTLPEKIRRILPAVAAMCKADVAEGGFLCSAEGLTLFELYSFVQSAVLYENWSALTESDFMTHAETSVSLEILSYSTQTDTLVFFLHCKDADLSTSSLTENPLPTPTVPSDVGSFDDGLADYDFKLTRGVYSEKEALKGLREEFGQTAELADWNEIKGLYQDRFNWFLSYLGVNTGEDVWVSLEGNEFSGIRHYFLARIAGVPRQGFLKHDQVGEEAWLGSWYGISLRVLVKVPSGD